MLRDKLERRIIVLLMFSFLVLSILVFLSEGYYGGGDSIAHFRISRYAFKYPSLFLDHWGKPVFTILSAPFSQLGFNGTRLYNILIGLLTSYLTWCIARLEDRKGSWLVLFFLIFAPIYFVLFFSALTELTFGLVLTLSVYFVYKKHFIAAAWSISFLPFVRTEGFVVVLIFFAAFLWYQQYKSIPVLFTGFVFFSLLGWPYYHDPLWVIHKMPYTGAADIYGRGTLFHFVKHAPRIFGYPLIFFWLTGMVSLILDLFKLQDRSRALREVWFVVLPFLAYFTAHSYVWWKGLGGSLGLTRVMAGVIPLTVITAMRGYDFITCYLPAGKTRSFLFPSIVMIAIIIPPFHYHKVPIKKDEVKMLLSQAAYWVKKSPYFKHRIYYYDLYFQYCLGLDPYDTDRCREKVPDPSDPGKGISAGSIVEWDTHYGPNEGRLPLEKLMNNPDFSLLKVFKPEHPIQVLGGNEYAIYIFVKNPGKDEK